MKAIYILLSLSYFICFTQAGLSAQVTKLADKTIVKAQVLNAETGKAVPFANVGFVGKGLGTVTDAEGFFVLSFNHSSIQSSEQFQISVLGFSTIKVTANQISSLLGKNAIIFLNPLTYSLDEVMVDNRKVKRVSIGNPKIHPERFGYWKDKRALGGEIATWIKIKNEETRIESLRLQILENRSDSLLIRVNVYDIDPVYFTPRNNLLKKSILHILTTKSGEEIIPLKDYNIQVDEDIIVSIELLKVFGNSLGLAVAGSSNSRSSFTRKSSQDYWKPFKGKAMAFTLEVAYPTDDKKEITERIIPDEVTVYWDASAKANNRQLSTELNLLEDYLRAIKSAEIRIHKFATGYHEQKEFQLRRGKTKEIVSYLENTSYDGETDYRVLKEVSSKKSQTYLLFTNGLSLFSEVRPVFTSPTFVINSHPVVNREALEEVSLYTDGGLLDLNTISSKQALRYLLKDIPETNPTSNAVLSEVSGVITSEIGAIQGAQITVDNSINTMVVSNKDGEFSIPVELGESLTIRFPGMKTKHVLFSGEKTLKIVLETQGDWLQEVVLSGKKKEEKVQTITGKKNKDAVGYKQTLITHEDIGPQYSSLDQVLTRLSNIEILRDPYTGASTYIFPRTFSMSINVPVLPIVVIDGSIYSQSLVGPDGGATTNAIPAIDIRMISSIVVTSSLSASNSYGAVGAGGAIVITTKNADPDFYKQEKLKPSLLIQGNDYMEETKVFEDYLAKPSYLLELEKSESYEKALAVYKELKHSSLSQSPVFFLDASQYFRKWNKEKAIQILTTILVEEPQDIGSLKIVAYELEQLKEFQMATKVYEYINRTYPSNIQSYRDLALVYQSNKQFSKAFQLYKQMLANETEGLDFTPIKKTVENELLRLLAFHKSEVAFQELPNTLLEVGFKKDRRLVFEWTDPQAEFEIQFVNPQGKYFKWSHTGLIDMNRIQDEFKNGYALEEFGLDDAPPGRWLVNIQFLGDDLPQEPVFLRYSMYLNYATPQESKEVKIIKLFEQKDKVTLGTITLN